MIRIIVAKWGEKYNDTYINNLKHMIDTYSGINYDKFEVFTKNNYGNMYNKLEIFDTYKDDENIYFDLDTVIYKKVPNLIRKNFTLLDDTWWREPAHTPLNSSIVSWTGDVSYIWDKFKSKEQFYLKKYHKGSDEFYFKETFYLTYDKVCPSIKDHIYEKPKDYSIATLGQMHHLQEEGWSGWYSDYFTSLK